MGRGTRKITKRGRGMICNSRKTEGGKGWIEISERDMGRVN